MNKVYPTNIKRRNEDDLYNVSIGVICGSCLCILLCVLLIVLISLVIDEDDIKSNSTYF